MRIIIAPNAFKGSLSSEDAAKAIAEGLYESKLNCDITLFPIADGGDGTTSLLNKYWNARNISVPVHDPLGREINASFGWIPGEKKVIMGISDASGLKLLKSEELAPLHTNTIGTGELIKAALEMGTKKIVIGVGGSATVDGGTGLLKALGIRYLNKEGNEIHDLPFGLLSLNSTDITGLDRRIKNTKIIVLCDVQNRLLGNEGAAKVFGPQKGAHKKEVSILEQCMEEWNKVTISEFHIDMAGLKYSGAAGGTAGGLAAYTKAKLISGIDYFLAETNFEDLLQHADLIITGEGSIDEQTLEGKGPFGVALMAKGKNIPVIGMAGQIGKDPENKLSKYFSQLITINLPGRTLEEAVKNTANNLRKAAWKWANTQC